MLQALPLHGSAEESGRVRVVENEDLSQRKLTVQEKHWLGELVASGKSTARRLGRSHNLPASSVQRWAKAVLEGRTIKLVGRNKGQSMTKPLSDTVAEQDPIAASLLARLDRRKMHNTASKLTSEQKLWLANQQISKNVAAHTLAERFGLSTSGVRSYAAKVRAGESIEAKRVGRRLGTKDKVPRKKRSRLDTVVGGTVGVSPEQQDDDDDDDDDDLSSG